MAKPNNSPDIFQFNLKEMLPGQIDIPKELSELFVKARSNYEWPDGIGATESQKRIIELEKSTANSIESLSPDNAKSIIERVSEWGGNNKNSQNAITHANMQVRSLMSDIIEKIKDIRFLYNCLDRLSSLRGLRLVMATKVYRFCCPDIGAALDRHTSYIFNSLRIINKEGIVRYCTEFKREWSTASHKTSRLAIYQENSHKFNLQIFIQ